jgi:hypothetical protein
MNRSIIHTANDGFVFLFSFTLVKTTSCIPRTPSTTQLRAPGNSLFSYYASLSHCSSPLASTLGVVCIIAFL